MRMKPVTRSIAASLLALLLLPACTPGPDYVRPAAPTAAAFKEAGTWQPAAAEEFSVAARWWTAFADPLLDSLVAQVEVDNQNLKIAEAQYRAARASLDAARSPIFPGVTANAARTRSENGGSGAVGTAAGTSYTAGVNLSWEVDLWGRIRRGVDSADAGLQASAADLAAARLSLQALLAQTYVQLRAADLQLALLARTAEAYARFLDLTRKRSAAGVASPLDVAQAETQLAAAQAQQLEAANQRAQSEHALAVLSGRPPAALALPPATGLPTLPATPALLPSTLLQSRPDIVAAERRVAAANARIGVAAAAWFPVLNLGGNLGYRNGTLDHLFETPNRFWSLGPSLALTLFDGGGRDAAVAQAEAGYDQTVASYRQAVLTAFQEVEDNLAAAHWLAQQAQAQGRALAAARRAREIAENQYRAGVVSALNVVSAQTGELNAEAAAIAIAARRLSAAIQLYKNAAGKI